MTPTDTRRPACVRSGVRAFRPTRRRPALAPAGVALLLVLIILLAGVGLVVAHAEEGTPQDFPRYSPASRGPRASYDTDQVQQWREAVDAYSWPTETALLVIACESQGDPSAVNPSSGATGLFQTMPSWRGLARRLFGSADLLNPAVNLAVAFVLWEDSGGRFSWHWYASMRCWS